MEDCDTEMGLQWYFLTFLIKNDDYKVMFLLVLIHGWWG
jgi:hypothetical protein